MLYYLRLWMALSLLAGYAWAADKDLTLDTANHAANYMEWLLDVRFNAEQRQHYQQILGEMWRNQSSRETIATMARADAELAALPEDRRAQLRTPKQQEFLRLLDGASDDKARWLLGVYREAHADSPRPASSPASLTGRWTGGHISSIQYQNAYTGVSAPTNGSSFAYEFKPDGTYSFTGLMNSVMYNCTTTMFSNETGTYTVEGNAVSLRPERNPYRMTNNCAPSSNREAPGKLLARTYRFRAITENGRRYLELRGEDGAVQKFGESR